MELNRVFETISRGFAPHILELDDWGGVQHIKFDGEHIGIICETNNPKTSLPKIIIEPEKMNRTAYAKGVGRQIFTLVQQYIQHLHEQEKQTTETERQKAHREFQAECIAHIKTLYDNGQIDFDKIKTSKSTESIYLYKNKKRILRISTHGGLKGPYFNSIVITPEEVETKLNRDISNLIGAGTEFFAADADNETAAWTQEDAKEATAGK